MERNSESVLQIQIREEVLTTDEKVTVFCNRCNRNTNHAIKTDFLKTEYLPADETDGKTYGELVFAYYHNQVLACMGCDAIVFRTLETGPSTEKMDETPTRYWDEATKSYQEMLRWRYIDIERLYPERNENVKNIKSFVSLPSHFKNLYREIIDSYNYNLVFASSAGVRAFVEALCNHMGCTPSLTLQERIKELSKSRKLSIKTAESLQTHRFIGNRALHQLETPSKEELSILIDILEHVLSELFEIPEKYKGLTGRTTNRYTD